MDILVVGVGIYGEEIYQIDERKEPIIAA